MGAGIETYQTRIGRFLVKEEDRGPEGKREQNDSESKVWFLGLVIMALLVIGGIQLNPGQQVQLAKIDQILSYIKNQEKENKAIKGPLEGHKQEMAKMKKGTEAVGSKLDK
jgi:hypothetical protein